MRIKWSIERSAFWVIVGTSLAIIGVAEKIPGLVYGGVTAVLALVALAIVSAYLSWHYWSWATHEDAIELSHGVIMRRLSVVPYHRVQQIDIKRDPIERMLGISTLILRSAAATTDAHVPGVPFEETESLRHALLARAGVDDAV